MKTAAISRFVIVAAIAALVVGGSTPLLAQITFNDFSSTSGLTLNGSAAGVGNVLRLTVDGTQHHSGSAWFTNPQQSVAGGFSTTFRFQILHAVGNGPADGLAFVIQNSAAGTAARGGAGGAIGYGVPDPGDEDNGSSAIPHSLAIEFDTFQNSWDHDANHVAIQSCGTASNSQVHFDGDNTDPCNLGVASSAQLGTTLTSGFHTVTITYVPPSCANCSGTLDVILDNKDLFNGGVSVPELGSFLGLANGTSAWVGFTGSTGDSTENNDILSWTFAPQAQSATITAGGGTAFLNFNGGTGNNAYDYNAQLQSFGTATSATVTINPILISEEDCEKLVDANPKFGHAQCFVYQNAGKDSSGNPVDSAVLFELTCPGSATGGTCGDTNTPNFFATLGSDFTFLNSENPGFKLLATTIGPYPGWLKGVGLDPLHPCTPNPDNVTPLFQSNQITSFSVVGDPTGKTVGKSGGGGSCWVATYATGGELPPGIKITSPTFKTYTRSSTPGPASYTCSDPKTSKSASNPTGPYLTAASCRQSQAPNLNNSSCSSANVGGVITCTGTFDLSVKGLHVFQVTSKDSGGNVNVNAVVYNVK